MKIAVFGLGYVGLTTVAGLMRQGHSVVGIDVNESKVREVNSGVSPIIEPGVEEALKQGAAAGTISARVDVGNECDDADLAIVCVGTPSSPDGSHNMSFIAQVSRQIARACQKRVRPLSVVFRSTFKPGTMEELVAPIFRSELHGDMSRVELVYNPEFLREGSALADFFNPPKIVIGTRDGSPCARLEELNAGIEAPRFRTRYREAELSKFVDNSFHAVKVAFANEIGRLCSRLNVSASETYRMLVADTKLNISPYYLRPGGPFGGSCLPKDVRALQFMSNEAGLNTPLCDSLLKSNEAHKHFLFDLCVAGLPARGRVLMLGLAFKQNSDDLRESPQVDLARRLLRENFVLSIYDESLDPDRLVGQNLGYAYSRLPNLGDLLISRNDAQTGTFDLIIDTNGSRALFEGKQANLIDLNALV